MFDNNISKPVSALPVCCPDTKGVQVRSKLNTLIFVVLINFIIDPVNFLKLVLIARVGDVTIILNQRSCGG